MKEKWQVVLGGEGGQGLVVAGILLGEAAVKMGKNVTQTAVYGIASRGGFTKAEVIIDAEEIEYPAVEEPDAVLALSDSAMSRYYGKVTEECWLIYDSSTIAGDYPGKRVVGVPLTGKIRQLKKERNIRAALNIIGLGALISLTGMVSLEAMEEEVKERFKKGFEANKAALQAGAELAQVKL